ncbi:MAG: hypothetical protein IPM59_15300 [Chloracidobacterium sp.]|nr:hypothetical protein [Chloracidobacterium sp.]MBK9216930.1 hypothetical protein [Chloracidobacterium sp.]
MRGSAALFAEELAPPNICKLNRGLPLPRVRWRQAAQTTADERSSKLLRK